MSLVRGFFVPTGRGGCVAGAAGGPALREASGPVSAAGGAAVGEDVRGVDEGGLFAAQERCHVGNLLRLPLAPAGHVGVPGGRDGGEVRAGAGPILAPKEEENGPETSN